MNRKNILALCAAFTVSVSASYASPQPEACPAIEKIITGGLVVVQTDADAGVYFATQINTYDTPYVWGFMVALPSNQVTDQTDALNKANAALASINAPGEMQKKGEQWVCFYKNSYDYMMAAVTPIHVIPQ